MAHIPLINRASMVQPFSQVGLAIDPPKPFTASRQVSKPAPRITAETLGRAWATLEKFFENVTRFFQRFERARQDERARHDR